MANSPDEARLKELVKASVVEALDERELKKNSEIKVGRGIPSVHSRSALKLILLWVLILVVAVGLYNVVQRVPAR